MAKLKRTVIKAASLVGATSLIFGFCVDSFNPKNDAQSVAAENGYWKETNYSLDNNIEKYFNDSVTKLPETVSKNEEISVIVSLNEKSVIDAYNETATNKSLTEFTRSREGKIVENDARRSQKTWISKLDASGINYELGAKYDTILNGFEIVIKAKDFEKASKLFSTAANLIVGETYLPAETEIITNDVDVYETGIFDTSNLEYQGDGVVVAVLDTGLDYTHTAFSVENFTTSEERFTLQNVSQKVSSTVAAGFTSGLTGEDVYVNKKVPFAYDYADKDPDVLPINSDHGTHVAGIIAGKDDVITGVAPNAQLAIMKVFSDTQNGAKTSWILAALEDCANLNVDVINMSLGSDCGFAREVDEERINVVYDKIKEAGISLITAAGNAYISTFGSEKNGSLNLTTNPDAGTIGSPSAYGPSLSVASVDGVKTPYFKYNDEIVYFTEASTSSAKTKDFVDDILNKMSNDLGRVVDSYDFEYVTIPGIGRASDYTEENSFYEGKIVLVKRGTTTFEEKVRIALKEKGAAGIIIYNNVSGKISMSVGKDVGAVCSLAQDEGEMLANAGTGIIKISRSQVAGPFMSDFSSWGPTSDLQIKPEITAHGGEILSAVPGQAYDRLSGTSMAAPNQAGAAALIRQYVRYSGVFGDYDGELTNKQAQEVTAIVNQLMMSTTDIVSNKNGLPYAVRKQGSGLVNIAKATSAESYLTTYDRAGNLMDRTKLELGDDKNRTGVYEMKFAINNVSNASATYDISSVVMTEGVSETYTSHGDTTVTQDGKILEGTTMTVKTVNGTSVSSNSVTVGAGQTAVVTVEIVLSDADKKYMDDSFKYGMFVEGFLKLKATNGAKVDLSVPMLAFYGDWTEPPIFDEEYFDTNKDEIDAGIDPEDKLMADAYATRVIGRLYSDYIWGLGEYNFVQNPSATQIAASKDKIAISNMENGESSAVNSIEYIWAGLLRNVKEANIKIIEDATGEVIFERTEYNIRKSNGIGTIYQSSIDVEFRALERKLKNNTKYTVTVDTYIDYGEKSEQNNARNRFEFPLYIDFQAPAVTGVKYRTEYDKTTKKTKLFADISVYDNHYAMGMQVGQIVEADEDSEYTFSMETFSKYVTPVYSAFNSTSTVTVELTDHVARLKDSVSMSSDGKVLNKANTFIAICYDYAMNNATYEISLPDEVISMYFAQDQISLSPNETKDLKSLLNIYPLDTWVEILDFESNDKDVVDVVNQTLIAKESGTATITATGYNENGEEVTATLSVKVLAPGEDGYKKYDVPAVNRFTLTGYEVNKAYYSVSSDEREIGLTDGVYDFGGEYSLSMFPSESVTLKYALDSNFPEKTAVTYKVGNSKIATVSSDGTIVAQSEGTTLVSVNVTFDGKSTLYSGRVSITVKNPFITQGMYLMNYKGLGGEVVIPNDRGITMIQTYAFSNYEYVEKDLAAGDVIDEEDPYNIKQMYIGEDTITKVVIPEGVTSIEAYAFAKLTALEEVELPTTLNKIGVGAFLGCEKLKKINLGNVKFINKDAFVNTKIENIDLTSVVAIGDYSFANTRLNYVELPESSQSLGVGAFMNNKYLTSVVFNAPKIKIGDSAFEGCSQLRDMNINAAVISKKAFYNCSQLSNVTLGKDVVVIGEYAFANTNVAKFNVISGGAFTTEANGAMLLKNNELVLVAPKYSSNTVTLTTATAIGKGAFAGKTNIYKVYANNVKTVGAYAFADCSNLSVIELNSLETVGEYAFFGTAITQTPNLAAVTSIGNYAFAKSALATVNISDGMKVGNYAFANCNSLVEVVVGDDVELGKGAFMSQIKYNNLENFTKEDEEKGITIAAFLNAYYDRYTYYVKDENGAVVEELDYYRYKMEDGAKSKLATVTIGEGVTIGEYAFDGNMKLINLTIGDGSSIGECAFFNANSLVNVDLSGVTSVGDYAFSGSQILDLWLKNYRISYAVEQSYVDGKAVATEYVYRFYAPVITEADLSSAKSVGKYAFAMNSALEEVTFGENGMTEIADYAFAATSIENLVLPSTVEKIGEYAFNRTKISSVDLSAVKTVGKYAFGGTALTSVTLAEDGVVEDGAFESCENLATVNNLSKIVSIGANAFRGTKIKVADISSATYVGDFAFGESDVEDIVFGDKLVRLGENPFYACKISTFATTADVSFNDSIIGEEIVTTYDISDTVKVIDDALYQVLANGKYTLVSYPIQKVQTGYSVVEGTARISARAFAGAQIENVILPSTLKAIGDRAFYDCEKLVVVVFKSYEAPLFEEEYLAEYATFDELPFTGELKIYEGQDPVAGLGIVPYYMWNSTSGWNTFYYGANFVDRIGHTSGNLVMVKPANGKNYETFISSQYFGTTVSGSNAAMDSTLAVIGLIDAIPDNITLSVKEIVVKARTAYDAIPALEQKALVTNYSKLTNAESIIKYLETRDPVAPSPDVEPSDPITGDEDKTNVVGYVIAIVAMGVAVVALIGFIVLDKFVLKKKKATAETVGEIEIDSAEEKKEESTETKE